MALRQADCGVLQMFSALAVLPAERVGQQLRNFLHERRR